MLRYPYVDSHTEGEPTRMLPAGGPVAGEVGRWRAAWRAEHGRLARLALRPPRGTPEAVVAVVAPTPSAEEHAAFFFNNVGDLGMCGHGTIGVLVTLGRRGAIAPGAPHRLATPVGTVEGGWTGGSGAWFRNVPSRRVRSSVAIDVPGHGRLVGDVAWGGNWFFLTEVPEEDLREERIDDLLAFARAIRRSLEREGVRGEGGAVVDHIELCAPSSRPGVDARNFVLCPGGEYDRSPCGTGTSAAIACRYAEGTLREGDRWVQEGILGTRFSCRVELRNGAVTPVVEGRAFLTGGGELWIDEEDPLSR
ncbi:MAG: proline racemase family protein [Thermoplasmata archaeon]